MAYTTINKSGDYFNTKLYTGNGSGGTGITGVGFQPDLLWIKRRNDTNAHHLVDAVRGVGYALYPDMTNAQAASQITSLDSDGFTLAGGGAAVNANSSTYAAWNWKANGQGSANTDGSINTTYTSVNTTAGFSISSYAGSNSNATIGHGLGVAPKMIIIKNLSSAKDWVVYHTSIGNAKKLELNNTDAETNTGNFASTSPTSTVFTVAGDYVDVNQSGSNYVAYCFAEKTGYSKFGSYVGNGNADGTFVYCGFVPSFVMTKRTDSTSDWLICDNKRPGYNVINKKLFANLNQSEDSYDSFDFVSNGFKIRSSGSGHNASGGTFIYMAFGQSLVGSNNVPCTAR